MDDEVAKPSVAQRCVSFMLSWRGCVLLFGVWGPWYLIYPSSFVVVNFAIAGIGFPAIALLYGLVRRDWRFVFVALAYAAFVYLLMSGG